MTPRPKRIGMLVPSSNTVLEPYTSSIFAASGGQATAHFARFRVVEISMSDASQHQFALPPILEAAERLAEAKPDLILWNGTSAAWLGLDRDRQLCAAITDRTGIAASSTMLAYDALFRSAGLQRLGVVTPYLPDIQSRIVMNFAAQGITVTDEAHLSDKGNHSFADYDPDTVAGLVRRVALCAPEAVAIICTNFRGAVAAETLEAELGIPVLDSVAVTAAWGLALTGCDPAAVQGWGSVFSGMAGMA